VICKPKGISAWVIIKIELVAIYCYDIGRMARYILPVEIEPLEEGGYLALCPVIQGCHAEGQTISEAMDNVEDVARILLQLRMEDGLPLPEGLRQPEPDTVLHGELLLTVGAP